MTRIEPCPHCPGARTTGPPEHPAAVAHWDADGSPGICPADATWRSPTPDLWPHPRT